MDDLRTALDRAILPCSLLPFMPGIIAANLSASAHPANFKSRNGLLQSTFTDLAGHVGNNRGDDADEPGNKINTTSDS